MGTLEKAGIVVVAVLIVIIVLVGIFNKPEDRTFKTAGDGEVFAQIDGQGGEKSKNSSKSGGLSDLRRNRAGTEGAGEAGTRKRPTKQAGTKKTRQESSKSKPLISAESVREDRDKKEAKKKPARTKGKGQANKSKNAAKAKGKFPRKYTIRKNDVLSKISHRTYDTMHMVKAIERANPGLRPDSIRVGDVITLPKPDPSIMAKKSSKKTASKAGTAKRSGGRRHSFISSNYLSNYSGGSSAASSTVGSSQYRVKKGDSLSRIAEKQLGSVKHYQALLQANASIIRDPDNLIAGSVLNLPQVN